MQAFTRAFFDRQQVDRQQALALFSNAAPVIMLVVLMFPAIPASAQDASWRPRNPSVPRPCAHDSCFHHTMFLDVEPRLSGVAGRASESPVRLPFESQHPVNGVVHWGNNIKRVKIRERSDEPCHIEVSGTQGDAVWSECGGKPKSTRTAGVHGENALVGIKICNNGRNDERGRLVKGVDLEWAFRPHETSDEDRMITTDRLRQPNCSKWRPWVRCPDQTAAQTLLVHHERIGGRDAIVGLQLECYPVTPSCLAYNDPAWVGYGNPIVACRAD